ncbi:MAG: preprotein translocase subunit SecG [Bacteroidetes bacterium]|nr:preprotein translocase subunit SecG [Bacteroidota bacterium]
MVILFIILVSLASILLCAIILIQNPKGGGLAGGAFGGMGNQFMGVKQTNDILIKGTWLFAIIIAVLAITSPLFLSGVTSNPGTDIIKGINTGNTTAPATNQPQNTTTFPGAGDSSK